MQIKIHESVVNELYVLIKKEKQGFLVGGTHRDAIRSLLNDTVTTQEEARLLIEEYFGYYERSLIEDLKGLTNSYAGIKEYLLPFIELGVVKAEYPHQLE